MKPILHKEQIQSLFKFVESKNVPYKDVQFEVVDHLASAIESELRKDPYMSFKRALQKVYNRFPITGFALMIQEKEKSIQKLLNKTILKTYFENIFSSYSLLTLLLSALYYYALVNYQFYGALSIALGIMGTTFFYNHFRANPLIQKTRFNPNEYLFLKSFKTHISRTDFGCLTILFYFIAIELGNPMSHFYLYLYLIAFSLLSLQLLFSIFVFPQLLENEVKRNYAHTLLIKEIA